MNGKFCWENIGQHTALRLRERRRPDKDHYGDASRNETIFDGGGAGFATDKGFLFACEIEQHVIGFSVEEKIRLKNVFQVIIPYYIKII